MRKSVSPSFGRTATRLMAAALLASVATGCSSDASRFGGLFSSSGQDNMTTSSVPRRTLFGGGGETKQDLAAAREEQPAAGEQGDTRANGKEADRAEFIGLFDTQLFTRPRCFRSNSYGFQIRRGL